MSKPPEPVVTRAVLAQAAKSEKPTVVCLLGWPAPPQAMGGRLHYADTLEQAAILAAEMVSGKPAAALSDPPTPTPPPGLAMDGAGGRPAFIRGLFSGGTLCYEAQVVLRKRQVGQVLSNAPLDPRDRLADSNHSQGHSLVDLGEEEFTVGRPHPMIDNDLRIRRMLQEARRADAGVLLMDVVLGYGAHPDPAAELGPAIRQAQTIAREDGRWLPVALSVTGAPDDPQGLARQTAALQAAGALVCPSNASAARLAANLAANLALHAGGGV